MTKFHGFYFGQIRKAKSIVSTGRGQDRSLLTNHGSCSKESSQDFKEEGR